MASQKLTIADKNGNPIRTWDLSPLNGAFGQVYIVNRTDLHRYLEEIAVNVPIRMNTGVTAITEKNDSVTVTFTDGKEQVFDLVIGADGVHSAVRTILFPEYKLRYFGLQFWMYFAPKPKIMPEDTTMIAENGRFFGAYPDNENNLFTIFALPAPKERLHHPEHASTLLKQEFTNFGWIVPDVLASLDESADPFFDTTYEVHMQQWHTKRVVLIGDSAHALVATASMGASMALEDAYVLADELAHLSGNNPESALICYQRRKEKRIAHVRRAAHFYGYLIRTGNSLQLSVRNGFLRTIPQSIFLHDIRAILSHPA